MKIKISSVAAEDLAALLRDATCSLENALSPMFVERSYGGGIEQFSIFAIVVDSDESQNKRFCVNFDKFGRYRDPLTHEWVKYISLALPFDPTEMVGLKPESIGAMICADLLLRLDSVGIKLPKGFNFDAFAKDMRTPLEIYVQAQQ